MLEKEYGVKPVIYTRTEIYDKYLNRGELDGYTGGEKYIDLNILNKDKKLENLIVK